MGHILLVERYVRKAPRLAALAGCGSFGPRTAHLGRSALESRAFWARHKIFTLGGQWGIARRDGARYSAVGGNWRLSNQGVRMHDQVRPGCDRLRSLYLRRDSRLRGALWASGRGGSAQAASAAAEELPARPDMVAARAQRQTGAGGARREPEDRRRLP